MTRYYEIPGGAKVPSVTTILEVIGKPALVNWAAGVERELVSEVAASLHQDMPTSDRASFLLNLHTRLGKEKAHRKASAKALDAGSQVHAMVEWVLRRDMGQTVGKEPKLTGEAAVAFGNWLRWRDDVKLEPIYIEQTVWSLRHQYAGTLDLYAKVYGRPTVLDWKTGKAIYPEARLQVGGAYREALIEMGHAKRDTWGMVVRLPKSNEPCEALWMNPEECAAVLPEFLAAQRLWTWLQAVPKGPKPYEQAKAELAAVEDDAQSIAEARAEKSRGRLVARAPILRFTADDDERDDGGAIEFMDFEGGS